MFSSFYLEGPAGARAEKLPTILSLGADITPFYFYYTSLEWIPSLNLVGEEVIYGNED
jgi:hypothetical protein